MTSSSCAQSGSKLAMTPSWANRGRSAGCTSWVCAMTAPVVHTVVGLGPGDGVEGHANPTVTDGVDVDLEPGGIGRDDAARNASGDQFEAHTVRLVLVRIQDVARALLDDPVGEELHGRGGQLPRMRDRQRSRGGARQSAPGAVTRSRARRQATLTLMGSAPARAPARYTSPSEGLAAASWTQPMPRQAGDRARVRGRAASGRRSAAAGCALDERHRTLLDECSGRRAVGPADDHPERRIRGRGVDPGELETREFTHIVW